MEGGSSSSEGKTAEDVIDKAQQPASDVVDEAQQLRNAIASIVGDVVGGGGGTHDTTATAGEEPLPGDMPSLLVIPDDW